MFKAAGNAAAPLDLLKLPSLSITGTSVDTAKQEVVVEAVAIEKCAVAVKRLASGELYVQAIAPPPAAAEKPATAENKTPAWITTVKKLSLQQFSFQGEKLTAEEGSNIDVDEIKLDVQDFSTKPGAKGKIDFSCRLNKAGTIVTKGECSIAPVSADLSLELKEINMADFQPFLAGAMNATLASGSLSTAGTVKAAQEKESFAVNFAAGREFDVALITEKDAVKCRAIAALKTEGRLCAVSQRIRIEPALIDLIEAKIRPQSHRAEHDTNGPSPA